jgi:hypothetical protein
MIEDNPADCLAAARARQLGIGVLAVLGNGQIHDCDRTLGRDNGGAIRAVHRSSRG